MHKVFITLVAQTLYFAPANSAETISYQYDVLGRLVQGSSSGSINNGLSIQYTIDEAGNRKRVVIAGSSNQGIPTEGVIVVPLNGFTIIPIGQ